MDQIWKSRSDRQKKYSKITCCIAFSICFILLLQKDRLLTLIDGVSTERFLGVMLVCGSYVLFGALCFCSVLSYLEEAEEKKWPVAFSRIIECFDYKITWSFIIVLCALCYVYTFSDVYDIILPFSLLTAFAIFLASFHNLVSDYDDVDLSIAQSFDKSIGALWAVGAYESFYKVTLLDILTKIQAFETENHITIPVKKLFIICPLSCNVNGSFNEKDDRIVYKDNLEPLECDQGANTNRSYKHSVYKIKDNYNEVTYVVAEYASPLGTLWAMRSFMNAEKFKYHRDCLIKNLKSRLATYACIVLEYDDQNPSLPLHRFLLSSIQEQSQASNLPMQEKDFPL